MLLVAAGLTVASQAIAPLSASAAQDPTTCQGQVALVNGGFEQPAIAPGAYAMLAQELVPGWSTTDSRSQIEIWSSGFQGVPAAAGSQFVELNANSASRLFQDVATTPGQTLSWSLKHRGRNAVDTMRVVIGVPGSTLVQSGPNLSDGTGAWGAHSGTYTVPAGQTTTRFGFEAVGGSSVGNFLDDITFGTGPCLISSKTVTNLTQGGTTAEVGDTLRYTITTRNGGGNPALESVSVDQLDPGLDFVSESIRIVSGPGAGAQTDDVSDDFGEYISGDREVRVRLGEDATPTAGGSIGVGAVTVYTFDARVNASAAGTSIANEARVDFYDQVANQDSTSTTQTTLTPVDPAADLAILKSLDTSPLVAGEQVDYTITVTNNGPQVGTGVTVTDTLPAGLTDVEATSDGASCSVDTAVSCSVSDVLVGETVEIQVTGTLSPSIDPGAALTNTATVTGALTDVNLADNVATDAGTVSTVGDVSITKTFDPAAPVAGEEVTYTLTARNAGPSEARDVVITDPLDPDTTFVSATVGGVACAIETSIVSCPVGTLAPNAEVTATIVVLVEAGATVAVQNTGTVTSSTSDSDPTNNASSTSFDPEIVADLAVVKTASVAQVTAGDTIDFTLAVSNIRVSDAVNVTLVDTLPAGFTVTGVVAPAGALCTGSGATVQCTWDSFPVGGPSNVVVQAAVAADAPEGVVTNTASVASPAHDANIDNNSSSVDVEVVHDADVGILKSAAGGPSIPGERQDYILDYRNFGPSVARDVIITDVLPLELSDVSAVGDGCSVDGQILRCAVGDLQPGAGGSITLSAIWSPSASGTITNTARVSSATPDQNQDNNVASAGVTLEPSADVSVAKTTSTPEVFRGEGVAFTVTVRNDGPSVAAGVVVSDPLPPGLSFDDVMPSIGVWSAEDGVWTVGDLLPGAEATLTITGTAVPGSATSEPETVRNTATASSQTPDPDSDDLVASDDVQILPSADLAIEKSADSATIVPGQTLTYTLTVENHGPSDATTIEIRDVLPEGVIAVATSSPACAVTADPSAVDCTVASLAVGEVFTADITLSLDPAAVAQTLDNTAEVSVPGIHDPELGNNSDEESTIIERDPQIELIKLAGLAVDVDGDGAIGAGDTVEYTFSVHNTGDVPLHTIAIDDPLLGGAVACVALLDVVLDPDATITCEPVTYILTQDDVNSGLVHNEASVTAVDPVGDVATDDAQADAVIPSTNGISLGKTAGELLDVDGDGLVGAGDTVDYTFSVTNAGTTTLSNVVITDPMLGGEVVCPELAGVELAPGQTILCAPVTHVLTQDDVDDGLVHNVASVIADAPRGTATDTAQADVTVEGTDAVTLLKSPGAIQDTTGDGRIGAGDTVPYSFTVINNGTTTLDALTVSDPLLGAEVVCVIPAALLPGASADCGPIPYVLTQSDIDDGLVHNGATVDGTGPNGPVSDDASADVIITGFNALELDKSAGTPVDQDGDGRIGAGDTIDYTFTIRNTGTTVLGDVVLADPLLGGPVDCPSLDGASLDPEDEIECGPVSYTLTQDDVDAGLVHNAAQATGQSRSGDATDHDTADVAIVAADSVTLDKTASAPRDVDGDGRIGAGDAIDYTFTVTNTGTTTLRGAVITDALLGGTVVCDDLDGVSLAPGDVIACAPATYTLTQGDVDAGFVHNEASVTAIAPADRAVSDDDDLDVAITPVDAVTLDKTASAPRDVDGDGRIGAGDAIDYTFTVTNSGTTTLEKAAITDDLLGGAVVCAALDGVVLAPGDVAACAPVMYTLTSGDIEAGLVHNEATVEATAPADRLTTDDDEADVSIAGIASIALVKTADTPVDTSGDGRIGAGDTVEYTFAIRNTGTLNLTDVVLTDALLGGDIDCSALAEGALAPGDEIVCGPVPYTLTQSDVDAGVVHNEASVSGDSVRGPASDDDDVDVVLLSTAGVSLVKSAGQPVDENGDGVIGAGDSVTYGFSVRNTGTTTLTDVVVTDPKLGGVIDCTVPGGVIAPGESVKCAPVTYLLTQADVDAGLVHNEASVTASSPRGRVSDIAEIDVAPDSVSGLELDKRVSALVDADGDGRIGEGDEIEYAFTVRNLGTTTLTALTVTDPLLGGEVGCAATDIAPGDSVDCGPARHTLTAEDLERGFVDNVATASAGSASGPVSDDGAIQVAVIGDTGIVLEKSASEPQDVDGDGRIGAGDTIDYTFTVRNTGTTTLTGIVLDDPLLGGTLDCDAGVEGLAPGAEITCGPVSYTLVQEDIDAGTVHNEANVTADGLSGVVHDTADADVDVRGVNQLELVKSAGEIIDADGDGRVNVGDTIVYTFTVTNSGTTTVTDLVIDDARLGGEVRCEITALAPGEQGVCEAPPMPLTQAEVDAGRVVNTATVSGTGAGDAGVTDEDTVTTPIDAQAAISLDKTGGEFTDVNGDRTVNAGDTVQFRFLVTNNGAVTLTDVALDDPLLGGVIDCDFPDLAPGESAECGPISHTITDAEVKAGAVVNAATATASGGGLLVSGTDSVIVDLSDLAATGGPLAVLLWVLALALLLAGLIALMIARTRRQRV